MKTVYAALLTACGAAVLVACASHQQFGHKATPAQQAATNVQLAIEYMKLGKLADSRQFIERALKQDPGNADVQLTAGLVFERVNEMPAAEHAYSTAERIGKNDPNIQNAYAGFLCRNGKTAAGEKLFDEVARNPLYQTPEVALVNAGVCVRSAGDIVDAVRYFNRALTIRPNMPEALLQLGQAAIERGEGAEALDYVQRFLSVNPATPEALWLGFRAQRKLGDAVAAAVFERRIETEFPNSEQGRLLRAGVER